MTVAETGQMLSSTLMDDTVPRADMLPALTTELSEVPATPERVWRAIPEGARITRAKAPPG